MMLYSLQKKPLLLATSCTVKSAKNNVFGSKFLAVCIRLEPLSLFSVITTELSANSSVGFIYAKLCTTMVRRLPEEQSI